MKHGNRHFPWHADIWQQINQAVRDEGQRIKIAAKFLPRYEPMLDARTVPQEAILETDNNLMIDEAPVTPLNEIWVEFTLTRQQVELEPDLRTDRTLAIRAANTLAQAEDALIFQDDASLTPHPLFLQNQVQYRSGPAGSGLLNASFPEAQELFVPALETDQTRYGEQTFEAVSDGYQRLQARGHHGPYALVLHPTPYADTHAALPTTLLMPASRIRRLLKMTFYGTNTLPAMTGLLLSVGGSTMELVMGRELMATFMFEDPNGKFRFRVWERFALRLRDQSAVMRLNFQTG